MAWTERTELLIGQEALARLKHLRVILFGVGGVGSWCAEALVRSGVEHLTIVDPDRIVPSNINRQLPALPATVGQLKVDVLRQRLLDINPEADIASLPARYTPDVADTFHLSSYSYVIDAIDSLHDKADLIRQVCAMPSLRLISAMGAACKLDACRVRVAEFAMVRGCPLAKALRKLYKHQGDPPTTPFRCVYSEERPARSGTQPPNVNGSVMHVTATFGLVIASIIIRDNI